MTKSERFLTVYSGVLTLVFAVVVLTGAGETRNAKFDEIDVQRINVREADGTLRLVVSNNSRMPGLIHKGKEHPHPNQGGRGAGIIFFNDEGSESGGLTFDGQKGPDGKVRAGGHFSFDQYDQDQVLVLTQKDADGTHRAGLGILDRPEQSLMEMMPEVARIRALPSPEREKQWAEFEKNYQGGQRLFVGKDESRAAILDMKDADNRTRLRLRVAANGKAKIEFLDAEGKVQRTLAPDSLAAK